MDRPALENSKTSLPISYARNGLAIIASALLPPGSKVLLPAYHCPALVEPFVWAQCDVEFYPLQQDLSIDLDVITDKLAKADAIVLVPFFGFSQNIASQTQLAREYNCLPIEDLAHAAHATILHGDYGVTSLQKFYPISTGGELLIANSISDTRVTSKWHALQVPQWQWAGKSFSKQLLAKLGLRREHGPTAINEFRYFEPTAVSEPMFRSDQVEVTRHDHAQIAASRRNNYQMLDGYLSNSRLGKSLFPKLGPGDVPYVYPFVLNKAEYFDLIRNMAIPLYRWEEICPSECTVSAAYRSRLIQLPCHQDLTANDIKRLISRLKTIEQAAYK